MKQIFGLTTNKMMASTAALALLTIAGTANATWSILLVDTRTGEIALGSATCLTSFDLRANTPVIITGVGAATAQSFVDSSGRNRVRVRDGLARGLSPAAILADLATFDGGHQTRQYGIIDTTGRAGTFSGTGAGAWAGGVTGEIDGIVYAVQGNLLTGPAVVDDAVAAIIATPGDLAEKLMAGMEAAQARGGDARCSCTPLPIPCGTPPVGFLKSADIGYMMIARAGDTDGCNGLYPISAPVRGVAVADINGDGAPDVLAADTSGNRIATRLNAGASVMGSMAVLDDATFDTRPGRAERVRLVDATGDGVADLVAYDSLAGAVAVSAGDGMGGFGEPARTSVPVVPGALLALDLGGDGGASDLFIGAASGGQAAILRSDGAGGFTVEAIALGGDPRQWAAGDLDGDGLDDVGFASATGIVGVLLNDGAGGLALGPVGLSNLDATVLHAADMDGDGRDELVGVNRTRRELVVVGLEAGAYAQVLATLPRTPNFAAVGSVTRPGVAEVVVSVSDLAADVLTYRLDAGVLGLVSTTGAGLLPRDYTLADMTGDGLDELVGVSGSNLVVIGNAGGAFMAGPGCGAGSHYMNFNIANQLRADPDPVFQLRDAFDQWRSDWTGYADAVRSEATVVDPQRSPGQRTRLRVLVRDWQGEPATLSTAPPRVTSTGAPTLEFAEPVFVDGGWTIDATVGPDSALGEATLSIVVDDAGAPRPVTLMPTPTLTVVVGCFADFDGDGELTIFDFLGYQNAFAAGDLRADCDGSGALDIFDFLCFQNAFAAGC